LPGSVFCVSLCLGWRRRVLLLGHAGGQPGLYADAEAKLKWGKILTLVGSVMGMLSTTLSLICAKRVREPHELNRPQRDAVTRFGPAVGAGGAGTGKTRRHHLRIARLIQNGTLPQRILAVTFTTKRPRRCAKHAHAQRWAPKKGGSS